MPAYLYKCPSHGYREVVKPMAQAHEPAYCKECCWDVAGPKFMEPMRRVWSVPSLIVRPHGYHLKPGEPGYWDINRALEVGHVPTPDGNSRLGAGAPTDEQLEAEEYAGARMAPPDEDGMQKLAEVARATFSESGSRL